MSVFCYDVRDRLAECREHRPDAQNGKIELRFPEGTEGTLVLGGKRHTLRNARVTLPLSELPDGKYYPTLLLDGDSVPTEGIIVKGNKAEPVPMEDWVARIVLCRLAEVEDLLALIRSRVDRLTPMVKGNGLFEETEERK